MRKISRLSDSPATLISAATSTEELGNPVYPPARAELASHGISCRGKYAVQLKKMVRPEDCPLR
ncbi:MAG: hypothetical protein IKH65_10515, partial [Clostridia bacterium]|nr:hypothetical protein [Clostridia bacterium]